MNQKMARQRTMSYKMVRERMAAEMEAERQRIKEEELMLKNRLLTFE